MGLNARETLTLTSLKPTEHRSQNQNILLGNAEWHFDDILMAENWHETMYLTQNNPGSDSKQQKLNAYRFCEVKVNSRTYRAKTSVVYVVQNSLAL